jgi:hypothetical protein
MDRAGRSMSEDSHCITSYIESQDWPRLLVGTDTKAMPKRKTWITNHGQRLLYANSDIHYRSVGSFLVDFTLVTFTYTPHPLWTPNLDTSSVSFSVKKRRLHKPVLRQDLTV